MHASRKILSAASVNFGVPLKSACAIHSTLGQNCAKTIKDLSVHAVPRIRTSFKEQFLKKIKS